MSLDTQRSDRTLITSVEQLAAYFRTAERPREQHKVGLEHEKLVYPVRGDRAVPYEGPNGIGAILQRMESAGYTPFREFPGGPAIAATRGAATISLEPGGQLELSGTAVATARQAHEENVRHVAEVKEALSPLGLRAVALGYRPFDEVPQMPWMPKSRYSAMRGTLGERGRLALDMMLLTATGQVSLDWADEQDCARKMAAAARLSPLMVALYANSPLRAGKPSGYQSFRSQVWREVDPARCGFLPSMLDGTFTYRAYVEWALDAPLLFLRRDGKYLTPRLTFRQLMKDGFEGQRAEQADWTDHLSTLFPEVRIKKVLEIRGADCVGVAMTGALAALWRGLLYDSRALEEALELIPNLGFAKHQELSVAASEHGLRGRAGKLEIAPLAREMVQIAQRGLKRLDAGDAPLLEPLEEIAASGRSLAERVLEAWERDRDPIKLLDQAAL
jgi:glutamate--cysteine ligase